MTEQSEVTDYSALIEALCKSAEIRGVALESMDALKLVLRIVRCEALREIAKHGVEVDG